MSKNLSRGECILINLWSAIAFDETCTATLLNVSQLTYNPMSPQGIMLRVEGPGNVYFSSHGNGPRSPQETAPQFNQNALNPRNLCLKLLIYIVITYILLILLAYIIIDDDFLDNLKEQLRDRNREREHDQVGNNNNRVDL